MILKKHLPLIVITLLFVCCQQNSQKIEEALKLAGNNRVALEKVIKHYQAPKDSLKLKATYFLIENMENKYSDQMSHEDNYRKELYQSATIIDPFAGDISASKTSFFLDSINPRYSKELITFESDLNTISSEMLINNIDLAFEKWNSYPHKKDYTTEEFFRWVLPYRVGYERLENWREKAIKSSNSNDVENILAVLPTLYNAGMSKCMIATSFSDIDTIKRGTCDQLASFALFLTRANGIPSAIDCVPAWSNRSGSHVWNTLLLPKGKIKGEKFSNNVSKIYRRSFEVQRDEILYKYRETESIPAFFSNFDLIDVTSQYNIPTSTITINNLKKTDSKLVWLSTFNNFNWVPVAYTKNENGQAVFKKMARGNVSDESKRTNYISTGKGVVYLPSFYKNNNIISAASPFILKQNGIIKTLEIDTLKKQSLYLMRKYPKQESFELGEKRMVGGKFEGSNRIDFKDAETILEIQRKQKYCLESFRINPKKRYRYFRFIKKDSCMDIAEINFFNGSFKLNGKPINDKNNILTYPVSNLFDGKLHTYCQIKGKSTVWIGLDFSKATKVTAISFSSRTDDNEISIGDTYQLSYWNQGWVSVGSQIAKEHVLRWDNLPTNTLYLLRNLSRGIEQRIFTYENEKQVWW